MDDGAPCDKSKVIKNFLGKKYIRLLDWSWNWPDLNPIKNLLMLLKKKVLGKQPKSQKSFVGGMKELWTERSLWLVFPN